MSAEYSDSDWMQRALALADQAAALDEVPVGAVVVRDGEEIGCGYNAPISSHDPTGHAEVRALRDAAAHTGNYRLSGATLYVTIEPCTMCAGALVHARISRLVFGAREPKAGAVVSRQQLLEAPWYNWTVTVAGGVLEQACRARISTFFEARRQAAKTRKKATQGQGAPD